MTVATCGVCARPIVLVPRYEGSRWQHVETADGTCRGRREAPARI